MTDARPEKPWKPQPTPPVSAYSKAELERAAEWPAVRRALSLLERPARSDSDRLRLKRHEAWAAAAVATFLNRADARSICWQWSLAVDSLIAEAWAAAFEGGAVDGAASTAVFALGKLGARELNLSSDVDLLYVRADGAAPPVRALRDFQALLAQPTPLGFCCRVDLTIRPGGPSAPICPSYSEFENHYGYMGETWERLAMIRLRALAGPDALKAEIEGFAKRYAFRRHLDYTLLEDLRALRSRIRAEGPLRGENEFHLKLGKGGIRELELFVHALQAMHGGRLPSARQGSTSEALAALADAGRFPKEDVEFLDTAYWRFRALENRLQAFEDMPAYWIDLRQGSPAAPAEDLERLAATAARVAALADSLLGREEDRPAASAFANADAAPERLRALGFSAEAVADSWPRVLEATALSRRTERDEAERLRFLANFVERLAEAGLDKDLGLALLGDFARATRAKASFFSMLNREPRLVDDLARLFSSSPYLGGLLCARPELMDSFLLRAAEAKPPDDLEAFLEDLAERRLLTELIAANQYLSNRRLGPLQSNLSDAADSICALLLARIREELSVDPKRPAAPGSLSIVALGKWGGRELGIRSDLDFILASDGEPGPDMQKVAKRFISWLSQPRRGGSIYAVDMRLRPSGASGPLLTSWARLKDYAETKAAAWERQAYLKSRSLGGASFSLAEAAAKRGLNKSDRDELRAIRDRLHAEAPGEIDLKLAPGGMARVEFAAQIALLDEGRASLDPSTHGMIQCLMQGHRSWREAGPDLMEIYERLRAAEQMHRLTANQAGSKLRPRSEAFARLASALRQEPDALESGLRVSMKLAEERLAALDPLARD